MFRLLNVEVQGARNEPKPVHMYVCAHVPPGESEEGKDEGRIYYNFVVLWICGFVVATFILKFRRWCRAALPIKVHHTPVKRIYFLTWFPHTRAPLSQHMITTHKVLDQSIDASRCVQLDVETHNANHSSKDNISSPFSFSIP